jgi:hypothetical protein
VSGWLLTAGLVLAPLPVGVAAGIAADAALSLTELAAVSRAHPGGIPTHAVPWHLRGHVTPARCSHATGRRQTTHPCICLMGE